MSITTIILAAGKSTRMNSLKSKLSFKIVGKPIIEHVVKIACQISSKKIICVLNKPTETYEDILKKNNVVITYQKNPRGTAEAVQVALKAKQHEPNNTVLILYGDVPFISKKTLTSLISKTKRNDMCILTAVLNNPFGYGRIIRSNKKIVEIIEEKDANLEIKKINEINTGIICIKEGALRKYLKLIKNKNKQREYYLTDLIKSASSQDEKIGVVTTNAVDEIIGINTRVHLAEAETALRTRINNRWMERGVTLIDPANTYIDSNVEIGLDTIVLPNTHLQGNTVVGSECTIGPNSTIRHSVINDRCKIESSVVEHATLGNDVDVGPFGHLRAGAHLDNGVHVGNFGEVKNSYLGPDVKMGHFSYVGDATIGARTNIGAGAITCNYGMDKNKHRTEIGEDVFIGSDTMLVAPLHIGSRVRTGAGSVVTKDLPDDSLAVGVPARIISRAVDDDIQLKDE